MAERAYAFDPAASTVRVRTRAKGLLAKLAHDLEIVARGVRGSARAADDAWSAELVVQVAALEVAGTLRGDRLDPGGLSGSDRAEIQRRMREDALRGAREIAVTLEGNARERGTASLSIGGGPRARFPVSLRARDTDAGGLAVTGRAELSLAALGIAEIRAPLGAFKLSDAVEVLVDLALTRA
jgi:hypothetical protein